ncbi:MAG: hypothetical protein KC733_09385, partial [Candidatus Omnitrophica bacterium]|nr:hypothetical protein [Candidatus Omnitrophota bacterium]
VVEAMETTQVAEEKGVDKLDQLLETQDAIVEENVESLSEEGLSVTEKSELVPMEAVVNSVSQDIVAVEEKVGLPKMEEVKPVEESIIAATQAEPEEVKKEERFVEENIVAEAKNVVVVGSDVKVEKISLAAASNQKKQIEVTVEGSFIKPCVMIDSITEGKDFVKKVFWVKINTIQAKDCGKTMSSFNKTIQLDIDGVSGGEYTFEISGWQERFMIFEGKDPFFEIKQSLN